MSPTPNDPLGRALRNLRAGFAAVAGFGVFTNLLLLVPSLYMLQVYDRSDWGSIIEVWRALQDSNLRPSA